MAELLVATKNPGKFKEIQEVLGDTHFDLVFLGDLAIEDGDFLEDGETFEENALKKAKYYHDKTGTLSLGEDSGILVEALPGELGVKTRRWGAGEKASDEEWLAHFLERMNGEENRMASFVCSACLYGKGVEKTFISRTDGVVTREPRAPIMEGLCLSSCFVPEGFDKVYASLGIEEKNKISHRGKTLKKIREFLLQS